MSFQIGDAEGVCCTIAAGMTASDSHRLFSVSKMATAYTIFRIIDAGKLSLDTTIIDVFESWTDYPPNITVQHLLSQTSGLVAAGGPLCDREIRACAKEMASQVVPTNIGTAFEYNSLNFQVVAAMAVEVTGLSSFPEVFYEYVAQPLGMSAACYFGELDVSNDFYNDPSGEIVCNGDDFTKLLQAIVKGDFVSENLMAEAEKVQTTGMKPDSIMAQFSLFGYGLGQWVLANSTDVTFVNSVGMLGAAPWVVKSETLSYFGMLVRYDTVNLRNGFMITVDLLSTLEPLSTAAMTGESLGQAEFPDCDSALRASGATPGPPTPAPAEATCTFYPEYNMDCDGAWENMQSTCASSEATFGVDCSGCECLGDQKQSNGKRTGNRKGKRTSKRTDKRTGKRKSTRKSKRKSKKGKNDTKSKKKNGKK